MHRGVRLIVVTALLALCTAPRAQAQDVEPQMRTLIETFMDMTNTKAMSQQMANVVAAQLLDQLKRTKPDTPERASVIVREQLATEFTRMLDGSGSIHDELVLIYAKHFTRDELTKLIDFYKTPLGRKALTEMPAISQESAAAAVRWSQANGGRIMGAIQDRLRAEGLAK
jgi:hypothetical protein